MDNAHPVIRIFSMCESMKWNHLPVAGGLYDQHPDLLLGFQIIFSARARYEIDEEKKRERKMGQSSQRVAGRR